jgi:hypothetical protein
MAVERFEVKVPEATITDLRERLSRARLSKADDGASWDAGDQPTLSGRADGPLANQVRLGEHQSILPTFARPSTDSRSRTRPIFIS